jgi:hypothetical protein
MRLEHWLAIIVPIAIAILGAISRFLWRHFRRDKNIVRFQVEFEEAEDPKWIEKFYRIKKQTDKIVWGLDDAIRSKSVELELAALDKAVNELPPLIQELEALPLPKSKRARQAFSYYVSGLATYLLACRYFKTGFEQDDEEAAKEGARQIKIACELMDKSFLLSKKGK